MTTKSFATFVTLALFGAFDLQPANVLAQGTAFSYQGRLNDGTNPATGIYDLRFAIYDAVNAGTQEGILLTNAATAVSNGLFTVTLDFGDQFPGADRWLEIAVHTNGSVAFNMLNPRQKLTPAPYAITAENVSGLVVQQDTNNAPNIILGSPFNYVSSGIIGATVSGGGSTNSSGNALSNSVAASFGTVSGGADNTASGLNATVGGGVGNTAGGEDATVSGGYANVASGIYATVSGGEFNVASGAGSFAAGAGARAVHDGSFVWSDGDNTIFSSTTNQFSVQSIGGARFITGGGGLKLGPIAQYFAPGGSENLRILRGVVDSAGNLLHGSGFTVTRTGTGAFTVTFNIAFGDFPAVTVAAQSGVARMATTTNVGNGSAQIRTFDASGAAVDAQFHFIAIGLQ